ncbi:MAG: leucine-rich repeat domain-containing protein [Clostridia bacterium]|nr:leucine-rich repeat domain-containing protein [Clostridia bacterium]
MKKKLLILLVLTVTLLTVISMTACFFSKDNNNGNNGDGDDFGDNSGEDVYQPAPEEIYETDGNGTVTYVHTYNPAMTEMTLPKMVLDEKITAIDEDAFSNCSKLEKLTIEAELTEIGDRVFYGLESLKEIILPNTLKTIGEGAFLSCDSLENVVLPDGLQSIGNMAFQECPSLKSVTIPDSVTQMGEYAFAYCETLTSVAFPKSLKKLEAGTFMECAFESVTLPETIEYIGESCFYSCESLKNIVLPDSLTNIDSAAFTDCSALESVTLPENLLMISEFCFDYCTSLKNVVFNDNLIAIDRSAFRNCAFETLEIPDSVTRIGSESFGGCKNLKNIKLPAQLKNIEDYAFMECELLEEIVLPSNVLAIGERAFSECKSLTDVKISDSLMTIGRHAFYECESLKNVTIGKNSQLTKIESYAFDCCVALEEIRIPKKTLTIGSNAFKACNKLAIYAETTAAPTGWASDWDDYNPVVLKSDRYGITANGIKWGLTTDGKMVVTGSTNKTSEIVLPDSIEGVNVTEIAQFAFNKMGDTLKDLIVPSSLSAIGKSILPFGTDVVLYSKAATKQDWAKDILCAKLWNYNSHGTNLDGYRWGKTNDGEMSIVGYAGESDSITIPQSIEGIDVTGIAERAFYGMENICKVGFSSKLKTIGEYAFANCKNLQEVKIPLNVENIGNYAVGCFKIIYCEVESRPTGWSVNWKRMSSSETSQPPTVWNCNNSDVADDYYIYVVEDNGVRYALKDGKATVTGQYTNLSGNVVIPDKVTYKQSDYVVTSISNKAFMNCDALGSVVIPDTIESISTDIFLNSNVELNEYQNGLYLGSASNPYMALVDVKDNSVAEFKIHEDTVFILDSAVAYCKNLTSIEIPSSVKFIGASAFGYCQALKNVNISNGVQTISGYAFYNCTALKEVIIPISVSKMGYSVFAYCNNITSIKCEISTKPIGWESMWALRDSTFSFDKLVTWGYTEQ